MSSIKVTAPDGSVVGFPEGTPKDTINAEMDKWYAARQKASSPSAPPVVVGGRDRDTGARATALDMQEYAAGRSLKPRNAGEAFLANVNAAANSTVRSIIPTAAGFFSGVAGGGLGALTGLLGGPAAEVTVPLGALAGGYSGGKAGAEEAARKQDELIRRLPLAVQRRLGQSQAQREYDAKYGSTGAFAGNFVPGFATGRPDLKNIGQTVFGGGAGALSETYRQAKAGEGVDVPKILMATYAGASQAAPTPFTTRIMGRPETRLQETIRTQKQPMDPNQIRQDRRTLEGTGVIPTPADILPSRFTTPSAGEAARVNETAARLLTAQADTVAGRGPQSTQEAGRRVAAATTPGETSLTPTRMQSQEEANIAAAAPPITVAPGEGGQAVHAKLNAGYDEAEGDMSAKFKTVDEQPLVYFQAIDPEDPAAIWQPASAERAADEGGKGYINTLTDEFIPADQFGPRNAREAATNVRQELIDQGVDIKNREASSTKAVIKDIGAAKTSKDFFDIRRRLAWIIQHSTDGTKTAAAVAARKALDKQIDAIDSTGRFADEFGYTDSAPVNATREANAARRRLATDYEGDDLIQQLTERGFRSAEKQTVVDPAYVSNLFLGPKGTVRQGPNTVRDGTVLRERLGADSPEWKAIQQEAAQRVMGDDPTKAATRLAAFEKNNPKEMVELFITDRDRASVGAAEEAVSGAANVKSALGAGSDFLSMDPRDFGDAWNKATTPRTKSAFRVALRDQIEQKLTTPEGAANTLALLDRNGPGYANAVEVLGKDATDVLVQRASTLAARAQKNEALRPPTVVSKERTNDPALAQGVSRAAAQQPLAMLAPIVRYMQGLNMSQREALQYAQELTSADPAKLDTMISAIAARYGQNRAQVIFGRVKAALSNYPSVRTAIQSGTRLGVTPSAEPKKDEAETPIDVPDYTKIPDEELGGGAQNPYRDLSDKDLGLEGEGNLEPASANEAAPTSKVPAETVSFVSSLTPQQAKALAIVGEAGPNKGEMQAVARVLENRAQNPNRYGDSIYSILTGGEFDAFKTEPEKLQNLMASDRYKQALQIVKEGSAGKGIDPRLTSATTHFLAPALMKQRGYTKPSWAKDGFMIGDTMFFNDVK